MQQPKVCLGGCMITSKTKINVFEIFSDGDRDPTLEKFQKKTLILAFEAKCALSCENGFPPHFSSLFLYIPIWSTINKANLIRLLICLWHFVSIRIVKWATCRFSRPHCGCFCCSESRCCSRSSGYNNITLAEK